jgi:DNA-directed RNA polymerase subunit M/transcription elongation factor TFIIS
MDRQKKICPKCGRSEYAFRSRKTIEASKDQEESIETKYRCKPCSHEWKVRVPRQTAV